MVRWVAAMNPDPVYGVPGMQRPWEWVQAEVVELCRTAKLPQRGTLTARKRIDVYGDMGWSDIMFEAEPW